MVGTVIFMGASLDTAKLAVPTTKHLAKVCRAFFKNRNNNFRDLSGNVSTNLRKKGKIVEVVGKHSRELFF